jgi:hypothetical protein
MVDQQVLQGLGGRYGHRIEVVVRAHPGKVVAGRAAEDQFVDPRGSFALGGQQRVLQPGAHRIEYLEAVGFVVEIRVHRGGVEAVG